MHDHIHDATTALMAQQRHAIEQAYLDALTNSPHGLLVITEGATIDVERDDTVITVSSRVGPHPSVPYGEIHYRSQP